MDDLEAMVYSVEWRRNTRLCMDQWALYQIDWLLCKMEVKETNYIGETARTLWDRGLEHLDRLRRK